MNYYKLMDRESEYGMVATEIDTEIFAWHLAGFLMSTEDRNTATFVAYLKEQGIKAESIQTIKIDVNKVDSLMHKVRNLDLDIKGFCSGYTLLN